MSLIGGVEQAVLQLFRSEAQKRWAVSLLSGLLLVGCQTNDEFPDIGLGDTGPPQPILAQLDPEEVDFEPVRRRREKFFALSAEKGDDIEKRFVQTYDPLPTERVLPDAPAVREGLEVIRDKLLSVWPERLPAPPGIAIHLTDASGYRATASRLGGVKLNFGIIEDCVIGEGRQEKVCPTQDDLAFIVAHEMSHILLDHHGADDFREDLKKGAAQAISILHQVEQMTGSGESRVSQKLMLAYAAYGLLDQHLLTPMWSRAQEKEADKLAVDLMHRAGFDSGRSQNVLERIKSSRENAKELTEEENDNKKNLVSEIQESFAYLKRTHPDFEERRESLFEKYIIPVYIDTGNFPEVEPKPADFLTSIRENPEASPFGRVVVTRQAQKAYRVGDIATAREAALRVLDGPHDPNFRAREVLASIREEEGATGKAIVNLQRGTCDPKAPASLFQQLAEMQAERGNLDAALATLGSLAARQAAPYSLHVGRIVMQITHDRPTRAKASLRQCVVYGGDRARNRCLEEVRQEMDTEAPPFTKIEMETVEREADIIAHADALAVENVPATSNNESGESQTDADTSEELNGESIGGSLGEALGNLNKDVRETFGDAESEFGQERLSAEDVRAEAAALRQSVPRFTPTAPGDLARCARSRAVLDKHRAQGSGASLSF